jgi:hypothetical protein
MIFSRCTKDAKRYFFPMYSNLGAKRPSHRRQEFPYLYFLKFSTTQACPHLWS